MADFTSHFSHAHRLVDDNYLGRAVKIVDAGHTGRPASNFFVQLKGLISLEMQVKAHSTPLFDSLLSDGLSNTHWRMILRADA